MLALLQVLDIYHDPSVALSEVYHPAVLTGIGLAGTQVPLSQSSHSTIIDPYLISLEFLCSIIHL